MALHFESCLVPLKPQIIATKAQLSQSFNPGKLDSLLTVNKWNIAQDERSRALLMKTGDLCINHSEKLEVVKHELRNVGENSCKGLYMVDALQRLNIDYHFQDEIQAFLLRQYLNSNVLAGGTGHNDIHEIALRFRLLRQQGHFVSPEVFDKFTNKEGKFNPKLGENVQGMINLYEASQLSIAGEDILEEAGEFCSQLLKEKVDYIDIHEAQFVNRTLEHPFHKSLPMFTARNFFGDFHGTNQWLSSLKEVAKLDFTLLQGLHHREIAQISQWWTGLGFANELKYARNQPLKWYIWSLACLTDPAMSEERVELTKPISLIYIIDDIFDVYGTLDELTIFTEAVSRWDITVTENLPDYMKSCFRVLYNVTNEISSKVYQKHGWDPSHSLQNTWKSLCEAFLVEAKWFASGKLPSAEEYLKNGIVSSGVHIVLVHAFFLLGHGLNKENVHILDTIPGIVSSPATILRLWDDLGNAEDENQRGNDGSYVKCLMMDHPEYTMRRAREKVMSKISNAWKSLNQECLFSSHFHTAFAKASLNLARMVPLMYSYDDKHSLPGLEEQVKSLLYDNVLL
ncbi:(3S,6E)-nerolidol synthase 1-like [Abrus precatorius]|uniref:(3S,6E)-nerolidol synthase 1-like n=1 Tax=Abrus precatorius TaxID=3816 RepID=A0A8B8KTX8_ABRPR|nr:(3S,6E)-nerolidol synthase 1-like [Abrus precatorius]